MSSILKQKKTNPLYICPAVKGAPLKSATTILVKHNFLIMSKYNEDEDYESEEDDPYTPMGYDRLPEESDEDYRERMEDLENFNDYFN